MATLKTSYYLVLEDIQDLRARVPIYAWSTISIFVSTQEWYKCTAYTQKTLSESIARSCVALELKAFRHRHDAIPVGGDEPIKPQKLTEMWGPQILS